MVGREEIEPPPFSDDGLSVTSFIPYPSHKPFINSDLLLKKATSKAFPESNRDAILDTLKKMQSKLKKIEQESTSNTIYAAYPINNIETKNSEAFCSPSSEELMVNSSLSPESYPVLIDHPISCCLNYHLKNIEQISEKTQSTENRVNELEKQLEKMRKILDQVREEPDNGQIKKKGKSCSNDLFFVESPVIKPKRSRTKSPERNTMFRSTSAHVQQRSFSQKVEIPFVVGTSISPSHNLGVNIQNVRSLFKICSPKRFQSVNSPESRNRSRSVGSKNQNMKNLSQNGLEENYFNDETVSLDSHVSHASDTTTNDIDFDELLCILQEDYTKLVLQHYEKTKQIMDCDQYEQQDILDRQIDLLKKKIRIKARQIEKVKKYQKKQKKINRNKEINTNNIEMSNGYVVLGKKKTPSSSKSLPNRLALGNFCDQTNTSMCSIHSKNLKLLKNIKDLKQTILN